MVAMLLALVLAQPADDKYVRLVERAAKARLEAIATLNGEIAKLRERVDKARKVPIRKNTLYGSAAEKQRIIAGMKEKIAGHEETIAKLRDPATLFPPRIELDDASQVGDIGRVHQSFYLVHVVDEDEFLARYGDRLFYFEGVPTDGQTDDKEIMLKGGLLEVAGTKRYGGKTVLLVRPFQVDEIYDRAWKRYVADHPDEFDQPLKKAG